MKIRLSQDLVLSDDFVTSTNAILGKKRVGKSYAAQVLAEELLAAKQHVVVLDLTSAWWGLRSSADGRSPGYPITIFGGRHGDLPLEPTAGAELAEAIVDERFSAVLDVRLLKKAQRLRFLADFLETLYDKNTEAMHLFMDEADAYVPQKTFSPEQARALGAADELVRRGGIGGIGVTMISQRAQVINKDVLSQVDALTVLRMNHPKDLGAIRDWIAEHVDATRAKEMIASLPALPRGEAWYWAPESGTFRRVHVRAKHTFDSGRTPKPGERAAPPKVLAKVDLDRLGEKMAAAVQRQKDNDPKELKKQVVDLRRELERVGKGQDRVESSDLRARVADLHKELTATKKIKEKIVEKPILKDAQIARVEKLIERASAVVERSSARVEKTIEAVQSTFGAALARTEQAINELRAAVKLTSTPSSRPDAGAPRADRSSRVQQRAIVGTWQEIVNHDEYAGARPPKSSKNETNGAHGLQPAHLRLLSAIAWWESVGVATPDLGGVAFVAKTSTKSSAFDNNRSRLRALGYIDYPSSGRVRLTEAGRSLAPSPELPPTNAALHEAILGKVTPAHGRMLRALIEAYPDEISFEDFAKQAGTSPTSSAFDNNRSWLRARGLAEYPRTGFVRATALLFPEIAA